jgi:5-oxoprolinase (ATP-hydrolysing) subunit C
MTALRVVRCGPSVTLQDGGRHGYLRFGVTAAGPMDPLAFGAANAAAGAAQNATAIEVSLGGIELLAEGAFTIAVAGGAFRISLDGRVLPSAALATLEAGQRLAIRPGATGAWCYVAVAGCLDIPKVLGSTATHMRSNLGGICGRALRAGDCLPIADARTRDPRFATIIAPWLARGDGAIRVVLGPQDDYFTEQAIRHFLTGAWRVSPRSDRMAYLLEGPRLAHAKGYNIVSDGIAFGAIQVPGEGQPVVLMADRQPTGGYPKIANVIGADLGKLAQLRPGMQIVFVAVSIEEAVAARRPEAALLQREQVLEPLVRTEFPSEFLLGVNLVDGVTDAAALKADAGTVACPPQLPDDEEGKA